jgi:hypothetical protein
MGIWCILMATEWNSFLSCEKRNAVQGKYFDQALFW